MFCRFGPNLNWEGANVCDSQGSMRSECKTHKLEAGGVDRIKRDEATTYWSLGAVREPCKQLS